ncbi:betaine--homocysteine S-methyltransferase 1-like isoform X3 [Lytechinus pictus]|uniref:betaine--homocysteine S-methyltransferase 1-like isoform X3 n=1 Tax=Lytechinus pictus TaxID=7653 RepID=UPI0030B9E6D9
MITMSKKGLLERLEEGPIVGDGSFVITLERRGYVMAGNWTPEACIEYPEAVKQLHREFLRAGADVMQTFTFYASEDAMGIKADEKPDSSNGTTSDWERINYVACDLAREVADEGGALVAGSLSPITSYKEKTAGKEFVQNEFKKQCDIFVEKGVDFMLGEFFAEAEEAEWAIEVMAKTGLPVACMMRIGKMGDESGVQPGDAAVRMAKAGANVVGVNCCYDPDTALKTIELMKEALNEAGLENVYLMMQPVGYHAQEIADDPRGYFALPEFPFAMEPRALTRIDVHKFARKAYDLGVRYIGGCCGFEPYHIRAIAEELSTERARRPPGKDKHEGYRSLRRSSFQSQRERANPQYWNSLVPAAGRANIHKLAEEQAESPAE